MAAQHLYTPSTLSLAAGRRRARVQGSLTTRPSRGTILTVDDDPDVLTVLRVLLTSEGFEVFAALSASAALQCVRHRTPDLVITAITMRGMTGLELCKHLRESTDTCHTPIVVHTAQSVPLAHPLYDCALRKPTDFNALLSTVHRLFAATATREGQRSD
jgi:CheY-like chemotaxis protein